MAQYISIQSKALKKIAPLHLLLSKNLIIEQVGPALKQIYPQLRKGRKFKLYFKVSEPHIKSHSASLKEQSKKKITINAKKILLELTGLLLYLKKTKQFIFISSLKQSEEFTMVAELIHELNTPLASIQLLAADLKNPSIESLVAYTTQLINGMRALYRNSTAEKNVHISVKDLIHQTLDLCGPSLRQAKISLITEFEPHDLKLWCRPTQMIQVLINLLNNAAHTIELEKEKWIKIHASESKDKVKIAVTNSGPKIPESIRKNLFHPFFTTKGTRGLGLGLSISRKLINAHLGKLVLDKTAENTCFIIVLPKTT